MISIENRIGRLIETRFAAPLADSEFVEFAQKRERIMQTVGENRVVCIDLSRVTVLPGNQADQLIDILRSSRPGLLRNAFLLPPGQAVLALQFARILRTANNPVRRAFQSRDALIDWLSEVLRQPEIMRLRAFLSETA